MSPAVLGQYQLVHRQPLSAEAIAATEPAKAQAEVTLFRARKAFKGLRC